jgi:CheY-like chemotaxis protein/Tfp pilus assembly protein PilF
MIDYSKKRFLLVDDFSDFRTSVTGMLRQMAVQHVDTASNGADCLALCRQGRYDIILHDYNLGDGKNGQQVLEELHQGKLISPHCIFVMVTAESSQAMVMAALECEPDAYLTKPFNRASLQQRLDKLVERKLALKPILDAKARDNPAGVVDACAAVARSHPRYLPQCQRYLADALGELGRHAELETLLEGLVGDRPLPWALVKLADHRCQRGQYEQARTLYEKGMQLYPMLPALYDGLARLHAAQGDTRKAQEYLQQGVRISPNTQSRQSELGRIARLNDDLEPAMRAYRAAVGLGKYSAFRDPENHLQLASVLSDQSGDAPVNPKVLLEIKQTLGELERNWKDDPAVTARSQLVQACALVKSGQEAEAKKLATAAAQRLGELDTFFTADRALEIAAQLKTLGQTDKAEEILATCAEMYGDDTEVMQGIARQTDSKAILEGGAEAQASNREGIRQYQQKDYAAALASFRKALAAQPRNVSFALNTAQSLLRQHAASPDPALREECLACLDQVRGLPASDPRHPRYLKLRRSAEGA